MCYSWLEFLKIFMQIFRSTTLGREAITALVSVRQGKHSIINYAIEICTVAADNGWNQSALIDAFLYGLSETMKDHLAPLDLLVDLEELINMASKIDKTLFEN